MLKIDTKGSFFPVISADDYEETDDESQEIDSDDEAEDEEGERVDNARPGSSKMVFNPLAALLSKKPAPAPVAKVYTKGQMHRMYLQRMGRRSRRW